MCPRLAAMAQLDPTFTHQPLDACADAALAAATGAGAQWADVRVTTVAARHMHLRDGTVDSSLVESTTGVGVRVIAAGAWGFAATSDVAPAAAAAAARRAVAMATATSALVNRPVTLAPEPVHTGSWIAPYDRDPVEVPDAEVVAVLAEWSATLADHPQVDHATASFSAARECLFYADTAGTRTSQQRVRCHPEATAIAITPGGFEDMTTTLPPTGQGWEYVLTEQWRHEVDALPGHLADRIAAPSLPAGRYDLVIAPSNLWLTIHESIGHATEYDRAIGFEANYAGTSFATPDGLGSLIYGSHLMNVTGDRTARHGLATVAWDHEGVSAGAWDLVRDGVLVGYQLDRWGASRLGLPRSNGCAYADSAEHVPLQRMPNVSLQPPAAGPDLHSLISGVTDGLLVVGDKSWSIDMNRRNFQFTAQRFVRIVGGQLAGQVKDVAYQSDTLAFWRSLVALGGPQTYVLGGAVNCGKGQPGQVAPVSHGCPAAVFEGVSVLSTKGAL